MSEFARLVHATVARWQMLESGDRVLLALSGGPDSTALAQVLSELASRCGIVLEAAHYNHGLRGEESDRDERAVQGLCARLGLRCHVEHAATVETTNVEERARLARYEFLKRKAHEVGCRRIATGHTLDDQAETVLMRLVRGTGLDGLAGIRALRADGVARPLIERTRGQVVSYLSERGVSYVTDSMNADRRFLRSRVRHEVLPLLQDLNPAVKLALARTAQLVAGNVDLLRRLAAEAAAAHTARDGGLDLAALDDLSGEFRDLVLRAWLKDQRGTLTGLTSSHLEAVYRLAAERAASKQRTLPRGETVRREYGMLRFRRVEGEPTKGFWHPLTAGVALRLDCGWRVSANLVPSPGAIPNPERGFWHLWADADAITGTLQLRNARPGDRIRPLGFVGNRKLQDVFVDRKLPRSERWARPVLEADGRVLWVPGLLRSSHALISPQTRTAWRVVIDASAVAASESVC